MAFIALGAAVGVGLLSLSDRPKPPDRGIVVVPGREHHAASATLPRTAAARVASFDGWANEGATAVPASGVPDTVAEGPIWDDGGATGMWGPPD